MTMRLPDPITSAGNAEVKRLRSLHERKFRRQTGWFLAEGTRTCTEAVELGWRLHRLAFLDGRGGDRMVRPLLQALERDGGRALPVTESLLSRISGKDNPQMVLEIGRAHVWLQVSRVLFRSPAPAADCPCH